MSRASEFERLIQLSGYSRMWGLWLRHKSGEKILQIAKHERMSANYLRRGMKRMRKWQNKLDLWRRNDAIACFLGMKPSSVKLSLP
jgi:hypothetical protein